jgi:membrane-associated protease RseP (regulator of RpoE activity)
MKFVSLRSRLTFYSVLSVILLTYTQLSSAQKLVPAPSSAAIKTGAPQPGRLAFEYILDTKIPDFTCAKVVHVLPNSPAEKGGLQAGMQITAIDNKQLWNKPLTEIGSMLSGEAGTTVSLSVVVPPLYEEKTIVLTRDLYDFDTVTGNTTRGKEALNKKDLNAAIYWLKKEKGSS